MKLSSKIILAFGGLMLASSVVANLGLKAKYEEQKGQFKDRYFGYTKINLKPYRFVKVNFNEDNSETNDWRGTDASLKIEAANEQALYISQGSDTANFKISNVGDTLVLEVSKGKKFYGTLQAATLEGLMASNSKIELKDFKQANLWVVVDPKTKLEAFGNKLGSLQLSQSGKGQSEWDLSNKVENLNLTLADSSAFRAIYMPIGSAQYQISDGASVSLKGISNKAFLK